MERPSVLLLLLLQPKTHISIYRLPPGETQIQKPRTFLFASSSSTFKLKSLFLFLLSQFPLFHILLPPTCPSLPPSSFQLTSTCAVPASSICSVSFPQPYFLLSVLQSIRLQSPHQVKIFQPPIHPKIIDTSEASCAQHPLIAISSSASAVPLVLPLTLRYNTDTTHTA